MLACCKTCSRCCFSHDRWCPPTSSSQEDSPSTPAHKSARNFMTNCQGGGWAGGRGGGSSARSLTPGDIFCEASSSFPCRTPWNPRAVTSLEISFCTERHIHPQLSTIFDKTNVVVSSTCGPTRLTVQSDLSPRARPVSHSCFDDGAGLMRRRNMV